MCAPQVIPAVGQTPGKAPPDVDDRTHNQPAKRNHTTDQTWADENYRRTWRRIRIARRGIVGAIALFVVSLPLSSNGATPSVDLPWAIVPILAALAFVTGMFVLWLTRCPRCGKSFTFNGGWLEPFTKQCPWCKLEVWSSPQAADASSPSENSAVGT
jgi:hypothetical protein